VPYDPATRRFAADVAALELERSVMVPGSDGPIPCRPALAHLRASFAPWTPERIGAVTGIEADKIREAAHMLSDSGSVAYYCWSGVGQHRDATQIDRAIALLTVLKGRHDAPGGNVAYCHCTRDCQLVFAYLRGARPLPVRRSFRQHSLSRGRKHRSWRGGMRWRRVDSVVGEKRC